MVESNITNAMDDLHSEMAKMESQKETKGRHNQERTESLMDPNRKAHVYGLSDGEVRYVGVSFYPSHQLDLLRRRDDDLGRWIRVQKPELLLFEQVGKKEASKKIKWWQRRFQEFLIKREKTVRYEEKPLDDQSVEELKESLKREIRRTKEARGD